MNGVPLGATTRRRSCRIARFAAHAVISGWMGVIGISGPYRGGNAVAQSRSVRGTISGRVISNDGGPIPGASVFVKPVRHMHGGARRVFANDDGRFSVSDLLPTAYEVSPYAAGFLVQPDSNGPRYYRNGNVVNLTMIRGGVVTGTITDSTGRPVVLVQVHASWIRALDDGTPKLIGRARDSSTDDRGVYRIYGLQPGVYLLSAARGSSWSWPISPYSRDSETFYPSSTRDTAAEVTVRAGQESGAIDIRYRGEPGRAVSGRVSGSFGAGQGNTVVYLIDSANGFERSLFDATGRSFAFYGIPDGEYDLWAHHQGASEASSSHHVIVRGNDVTGVELAVSPLGSIAGRVSVAARGTAEKAACQTARASGLQEIVVNAQQLDRDKTDGRPQSRYSPISTSLSTAPDDSGAFFIQGLDAGSYHLEIRPPVDWYVESVTGPEPAPSHASTAHGRQSARAVEPVRIGRGAKVEGLKIELARGAAAVEGRVVARMGLRLPTRLRVYLIPIDVGQPRTALHFAETAATLDGSFSFASIAPAHYKLVAAKDESTDSDPGTANRLTWTEKGRKKLRLLAESEGHEIELGKCQAITNYVLKFSNQPSPPSPAAPRGGSGIGGLHRPLTLSLAVLGYRRTPG